MGTIDATKIVGGNGKRRERDFYPTPPDATQALLDFICPDLLYPKYETVWEPACGGGAIVNVLRKNGIKVYGTDIQSGADFLTAEPPAEVGEFGWIITNPPFNLAEQFIRRADRYRRDIRVCAAFLLKSQYWHSKKRLDLFRECRPRYVLPLTWRPDFTGQGSSLMDMMWCVWTELLPTRTDYIPLERPTKG